RQERRVLEFQRNAIADLATAWAEAVAVNGLASPDEWLERLEKTSVADVSRVARQYLDLDHAVTARVTPAHSGKPVTSANFGGREALTLGTGQPTKLPAWAEQALGRLSVPDSTLHPVVSSLPNGITLIVQPEEISDTVSVYGHIKNRPELEVPPGKDGLSPIVDELLGYGSETLDRVAFQKALDDVGADVQAGTDFSLHALSGDFERGLELLADNELHPGLPKDAFEIVKRQLAEKTAGRLKSPDYLATRALHAALYPKGDPVLRQALPSTIAPLTIADARDFYRKSYRPDLAIIVVIGKVSVERARAAIEKYFGSWRAEGAKPEVLLPPVPASRGSATSVPDASRVQNRVTIAETLPLLRSDSDYYALALGNSVLGGAFYSTRLYRDLRKERGLVYFVESMLEAGRTRSLYVVQYACDPANVSKVRALVVRELKDMQTKPVGAQELQQAKALLLRAIPLDEADVDAIARGLIARAALELPLDEPTRAAERYVALSSAEVEAAFAKWLRPDDLALVSQGPPPR
ncbi:MAG: insulinase family protein, partial [Alphaproteobacteria bacterium]